VNLQETLKEHLQSFDDDNYRDFMDVYIAEMKKDTTGLFAGICFFFIFTCGIKNKFYRKSYHNDLCGPFHGWN
jgi:hypothetical protein